MKVISQEKQMPQDWNELTKLTRGAAFSVERIRLKDKEIAIEGSFELPPLTRLTGEDQLFVMAFVRSHGSIKEMESQFGISYPTVKNRLNAISALLPFIEVNPPSSRRDVLDLLERGEISADEAVRRMKG
jgi:hypothetical protein